MSDPSPTSARPPAGGRPSPGTTGDAGEGRPGRRTLRARRRGVASPALRAVVAGGAVAALLLPLVSGTGPAAARPQSPAAQQGALQREFAAAATEYGVPQSVLLGVAYLQSRWDGHQGAASVSGGYGPMHLTDAATALKRSAGPATRRSVPPNGADGRGDPARPARKAAASEGTSAKTTTRGAAGPQQPPNRSAELPARLRTLEHAAQLTKLSPHQLRTRRGANVRGGAALLADAQRRLGRSLSSDPADWYGAVAAYPEGTGKAPAWSAFADEVFAVLRAGQQRTTDSGQHVTLPAHPGIRPAAGQRTDGAPGLSGKANCPAEVDCSWTPAPYRKYRNDEGKADYGNHDRTRRPQSQRIDHIVVHDTEATYDQAMKLIKDPEYQSWHYTVRSADGHIAQHVPTKDVAWQAGNWYLNATSVGVEHEGFLADPDAWYTEAMYRTSARLVRSLAEQYDIPLDRQHILGHDNVPGSNTAGIKDMHTDPGPYWDWEHYFGLLGKPFRPEGGTDGQLVTIRPQYHANRPVYTGCTKAGQRCAGHGSTAVRLHTAPDTTSPLVSDKGLRPNGSPSTTGVNDTGARASAGQQFAVAERRGDWTAIWYLGAKAWFHNPAEQPTAVPARGGTVTPKAGRKEVPVYGSAYPEKQAYPKGVPVQKLEPLPYRVRAGQRYAVGPRERGEYLYAQEFDPHAEKFTVVRGGLTYYQIQLGHRVAFVRADDVRVTGGR